MVKLRFNKPSRGNTSQNNSRQRLSSSDGSGEESNSSNSSSSIPLQTLQDPSPGNNTDLYESSRIDRPNYTPRRQKARKVLSILDSPRRAILARTPFSKRKASRHKPLESDEVPELTQEEENLFSQNLQMQEMNSDENKMMVDSFSKRDKRKKKQDQNILYWLHDEAPHDILPKILSFAGIRKVQSLSRLNKSWRSICLSEGVWRTLCEDTRKWVPGRDKEPCLDDPMNIDDEGQNKHTFWKEYYHDNPIVPLDFSTIHAALASVSTQIEEPGSEHHKRHIVYNVEPRDIRIFLQPGQYIVRSEVVVQTQEDKSLTIETLVDSPDKKFETSGALSMPNSSASRTIRDPVTQSKSYSSTIRDILTCRTTPRLHSDESISESNRLLQRFGLSVSSDRATVILGAKRNDEPIFHIRQGTLKLSKILMVHYSPGTDIWNGNTAVQVQPRFENDRPIVVEEPNRPPKAIVEQSDIVSMSGRGVVAIDGGFTVINKCHIHNCAATGLYVGGPGSTAIVEDSDFLQNGNGNQYYRSGIARGHSGIYLEQGEASLKNCNISSNSLTGISAVSRSNAFLTLIESDLMGNGTLQLEMPPIGTESRSRSVTNNNNMSSEGTGRIRSGLVPSEESNVATAAVTGSSTNEVLQEGISANFVRHNATFAL